MLEVGPSSLSVFHLLNISDDMGNCRSKSNPANGPSEPQKLPGSNHNEDQSKAEEKRAEPRTPHGFQQEQSENREEEHGARERGHAGEKGRPRELQAPRQRSEKDRRQTEEKVLMYVLSFVILPSINAAAVASDLQVLERAK